MTADETREKHINEIQFNRAEITTRFQAIEVERKMKIARLGQLNAEIDKTKKELIALNTEHQQKLDEQIRLGDELRALQK